MPCLQEAHGVHDLAWIDVSSSSIHFAEIGSIYPGFAVMIVTGLRKPLVFSRWPGGRLDRLPGGHSRAVFTQAKAKGDYQAQSPLRSDDSHDSQAGGYSYEVIPVAWWPICSNERRKTTLGSQGT